MAANNDPRQVDLLTRRFVLEDGKYVIERDKEHGTLARLWRHGERWPAAERQMVGDRLSHALMDRIEDLEVLLERCLNEWERQDGHRIVQEIVRAELEKGR